MQNKYSILYFGHIQILYNIFKKISIKKYLYMYNNYLII